MYNKEKRSNLPDCGCRRCKLKTDRPGHCNITRFDEATDINSPRTRPSNRRSTEECSCDSKGENISGVHMNGGTFIRFTGPTNTNSCVNPAARVMLSDSKSRSTCGCFLEKYLDGKSRAFDLEINDMSDSVPEEYFRSVTIWQGFLNKPLNVTTRRSSGLDLPQADHSHNKDFSSDYSFCNGKSHTGRKGLYKKAKNRLRPEVGTQIRYQNLKAALFSFGVVFLF